MPNWTVNRVVCKKDIALKVLGKDEEGNDIFDFNKLIPMPKDLDIYCGSIEDRAVSYYYNRSSKKEKKEIEHLLRTRQRDFFGNYWNHYSRHLNCSKKELNRYKSSFIKERKEDEMLKKYSSLYELGKKYIDNIKKYNAPNWYDWNCENWGTKWDSCYNQVTIDGQGNYEFVFSTAWAMPHRIVFKFSELCKDEEFFWEYQDEFEDEIHQLTKVDGEIQHKVIEEHIEKEDEITI